MDRGKVALFTTMLLTFLLYLKPLYAPLSLLLPIAIWIVEDYRKHKRVNALERMLPAAALELALNPSPTVKGVLESLSQGFGALSGEIERAVKMVKEGLPARRALLAVSSESPLFQRFARIIILGLESGSNWEQLMRGCAEDFEHFFEVKRELSSALALQKYSILLSAAVFVPLVLGVSWKVARDIGFGQIDSAYLQTLSLAIPIHITVLAVLASLFAALMDGNIKSFLYKLAVVLPLSLGIYLALAL